MFTPAIGPENSMKRGKLQSLPNRRQKETVEKMWASDEKDMKLNIDFPP